MDNYYWETEEPLATNELTMHDWVDNHMPDDYELLKHYGTYAEVKTPEGTIEVHASGDGDFCNHKVSFVLVND